jgi:TonB family protein
MKLSFANYKTSHIIAFASAFAVHAGIVVSSMLPSNPVVINQQAIQVSFVAPSSQNQKNESDYHKKLAMNFERENAMKQKAQKDEKSAEKNQQKTVAGKETSGRVDPNSLATKAAESEPVFDAAYLNNPAPYYPSAAKKRGVQGKVLLSVVVKTDGTPLSVDVSRSSGSSTLDVAALEAVRQWRFVPAKKSGQPVQAEVVVPVEFKII